MAGDRELKADPKPVQRRVTRPEQLHCRGRSAKAVQAVFELVRLERKVIPEPFRLLVRVGVTPDPYQQRGVVDDGPLLLIETGTLGQPQRDHALAQHVLHRLAEAKVDPQRQRRHQLRQTDVRAIGPSHTQSVTVPVC